jgi:hypothetical protein
MLFSLFVYKYALLPSLTEILMNIVDQWINIIDFTVAIYTIMSSL